ncbi:hypothetical protein ACIRS1_07180 [Kitasatospora sp. NPDC101176]|uniref:hypothetical protein n=1 Tax=Kitasatospora sp. NPDC101176 TaxID=3364099 RepID=UPI00380FA187
MIVEATLQELIDSAHLDLTPAQLQAQLGSLPKKGSVSTFWTGGYSGPWKAIFREWLTIEARNFDDSPSEKTLERAEELWEDLDAERFHDGRTKHKKAELKSFEELLNKAYRRFLEFLYPAISAMAQEYSPENVLNRLAGGEDLEAPADLGECKRICHDVVDNQLAAIDDCLDIHATIRDICDGWGDLSFWTSQPKNLKLGRGKITLSGSFRDDKEQRLQDLVSYLSEYRHVLHKRRKTLEGLHEAIDELRSGLDVEKFLQILNEENAEVAAAQELLFAKVDSTAKRCVKWAEYHAGSNYVARMKSGEEDCTEVQEWIEVSDKTFATVALSATVVGHALGTPLAGGILTGFFALAGVVKKKVVNELVIKNSAQKSGVFTPENIVSSAVLGRAKNALRGHGKKIAIGGKVVDHGRDVAETALIALDVAADAAEGLALGGHILKTAQGALGSAISASKVTDVRRQPGDTRRALVAMQFSYDRDLPKAKKALKKIRNRVTRIDLDSRIVSDDEAAQAALAQLLYSWDDNGYWQLDSDVYLNGIIDFEEYWSPFHEVLGENLSLTYLGPDGEGNHIFTGPVQVAWSMGEAECLLEVNVTAEGTITNAMLSHGDWWESTPWFDAHGSVSGVVGDAVLTRIPRGKRFAVATYDREVHDGTLLYAGDAGVGLFTGTKLNEGKFETLPNEIQEILRLAFPH